MPVQIPESYRAYCTDPAVRTAVEHILGAKTLGVPADLGWDKLPEFHRAVLSAHQVRCEFAIFLHKLWNEICNPVLDEGRFIPKTVTDTQKYWNKYILDTYSIWDGKWFGRVFDIADTTYVLEIGVEVGYENRVRLTLNLWDRENEKYITNELDFGNCWLPEKVEDTDGVHDYAYSKREHAPIVDIGSICLDFLHKAAADALAAVERHCRSG